MTILPPALLPPERKPGVSATSYESLTRATLESFDVGGPFYQSLAADIAAHRWHFCRIPGVLS